MRFRVRGKLAPLGNAVIVKTDADNEFEAIENVAKILKGEGHDLGKITSLAAKALGQGKSSSVYVGAIPVKRAKRGQAAPAAAPTPAPAETPAPAPAETPAPAAKKAGASGAGKSR